MNVWNINNKKTKSLCKKKKDIALEMKGYWRCSWLQIDETWWNLQQIITISTLVYKEIEASTKIPVFT